MAISSKFWRVGLALAGLMALNLVSPLLFGPVQAATFSPTGTGPDRLHFLPAWRIGCHRCSLARTNPLHRRFARG